MSTATLKLINLVYTHNTVTSGKAGGGVKLPEHKHNFHVFFYNIFGGFFLVSILYCLAF